MHGGIKLLMLSHVCYALEHFLGLHILQLLESMVSTFVGHEVPETNHKSALEQSQYTMKYITSVDCWANWCIM